jgi:teichuronic acid biosynthesis glycosyltransferase TuaH
MSTTLDKESKAHPRLKVICFAEIQWRYVRTRKQQVLSRFPEQWDILFLSSYAKGRPNNFLPQSDGRVTHVCVPIFKNFPPGAVGRLFSFAPARFLWNAALLLWVNVVFLMTGFHRSERVFYVSNIYYAAILPFLRRSLMFYDCNDDHLAFPNTPPWAAGYYRRLVRSADYALAVSSRLAELLEEAGAREIRLVGNGVDYDLFRRAAESGVPDEMRGLRRPIIGYSGAVAQWFDFGLLDLVASSFPEASIVLVGPVFADRSEALRDLRARRANVHHLGSKPYERLGAYIAAMDVCIVPLVPNELMRSADPNKLYEYAACGRPIVTMKHSKDIEAWGSVVSVATSHEDFIERIRAALASGADEERLKEFARTRSWQARADEIASIIVQHLDQRRAAAGSA